MKTLKGISAASGIAQGIACVYTSDLKDFIPRYPIGRSEVSDEQTRLKLAFEKARKDMNSMISNARENYDKEAIDIFTAHMTILQDEELYKKTCDVIQKKLFNAEYALEYVFDEYIDHYKKLKSRFTELIHDFIDTRDRIIGSFGTTNEKNICKVCGTQPVIIVTEKMTPSLVLGIPRQNVLAFISKEGGFTSHATILARAMGVPIILGIDVKKHISNGQRLVIDGGSGKIIINPDKKTRDHYEKKLETLIKKMATCEVKKDLSPRMKSGVKIKLKINVSTPGECDMLSSLAHEGIGLLRTEFLFTQRHVPPTEEEQITMYSRILSCTQDKETTVRLLDIGTDKIPLFLDIPEDTDMCMGIRGAIAVETFPELYLSQVKALLRANEKGNLKLLYPMVSDIADLKTFQGILAAARTQLKKEKIPFNDIDIKEGVMVETPGAVMAINDILPHVDFVNIGSNDLLQYSLATSRGNVLVEKHYHILHPALVKFIEIIVKASKKAAKEVCLCGEISSFEEFYPLLIDIGLRSFSVAINKFDIIKCELLHVRKKDTKGLLQKYYSLLSSEEINEFFERFV